MVLEGFEYRVAPATPSLRVVSVRSGLPTRIFRTQIFLRGMLCKNTTTVGKKHLSRCKSIPASLAHHTYATLGSPEHAAPLV